MTVHFLYRDEASHYEKKSSKPIITLTHCLNVGIIDIFIKFKVMSFGKFVND